MEISQSAKDFVARISHSTFNYWMGYVVNLSLVAWLISCAFAHGFSLISPLEWGACVAGGLAFWTFAEYLLHRYLYHEIQSLFSWGHELHHQDPEDLLGVPWYITTVVIVGLYYGLAFFLNPARTGVVMGVSWFGYIGYCFIHHSIHHFDFKNPYFKGIRKHHLIHHVHPDLNLGITTQFWDLVFKTKKK